MITTISHILPMLGFCICLFVVITHKLDTRCPIRMAKMILWIGVWFTILYYDYPRLGESELLIMMARLGLVVINILYITEAVIYTPRKRRFNKCKSKTLYKRR